MKALLQRVTQASVSVDNAEIASISKGCLALVGVEPHDGPEHASRLAERMVTYRMFADDSGRMNRSLVDIGGGLLLVSQFTLVADTRKGTRPGFSTAATPNLAEPLFEALVKQAQHRLGNVQVGRFGADMQVSLVNDGPVTFWLSVPG
ncbi:D-aminoacyl-tRNA deacylase [Abyssibacter sp.]|jgi:D-tyrosyl-tRNA(Tyr) deacylase|uniref:D-aminoacyl-tRNA deacylase n=1 Tax=Abyssibacter sp. TaxID=2320200 RepID=UPI000C4C3A4B|nr:D-aminoacyl-tRNA deacylase [Abyssibacter sp.]MBB86291.1 D-tyrosyl-tRNA(Tyr) deacylase [Xanthomonadales bacterium]MCK5858360.1 D-tyrosyl-tRNA(Tyr) deacylase [Abyssibacter sp.]